MTCQILERINNNAYKIDCRVEFLVHSTFKDREDDNDQGVPNVPIGPITRSKAKKIQQTFLLDLQNWIDLVQPLFHLW